MRMPRTQRPTHPDVAVSALPDIVHLVGSPYATRLANERCDSIRWSLPLVYPLHLMLLHQYRRKSAALCPYC
jgi:hypothetical protein